MRSEMTRSVLTWVRGVFTLKALLDSSPMYFWSCSGRGVCLGPMAAFFGGGGVFLVGFIRLGLKIFWVGCLVFVVVSIVCSCRVVWGVRRVRVGFGLFG